MAIGIDGAILLETDGVGMVGRPTPPAAIVETIRTHEAADGPFDLILLGNEAADTGDYQVGVRVAVALDRPIVTGVKGLEIRDDAVVARREAAGGGWEVYEVPRPAVMSVREGSTCRATRRSRVACGRARRRSSGSCRRGPRRRPPGSVCASRSNRRARSRSSARARVRRRVWSRCFRRLGLIA